MHISPEQFEDSAKNALARETALGILTPKLRSRIAAYDRRSAVSHIVLAGHWGGAENIPQGAQDEAHASLIHDYPGTYEAIATLQKTKEKILSAGQG